ncbi:signal transduction histidine kinase [Desulfosporosinus orientis DSM 765]|uniref:histidine kinase n=1 Tax=Desulfosporosinus orientis (strain ATCC 19365 / DSM 765 / NCIMB 8382 / VKM B-1628 / Singapore I) TaxID=768706 RepID=G7W7S3_DESOD|nr:ATP-binding protein [Desulfosporosinus orientis]AET66138.1 signal transduction histidine kinase [Desulfosporosinus orientis DSM 765]
MFKKKIAFKLTASFVLIMLIAMLAIGILFIQMFRQYAFDSREETMLTRARSIAEVLSENSQNLGQIRGFAGTMHFLSTMAEANVWITDAQGNLSPTTGMGKGRGQQGKGQGFGLGAGMGQGPMYNSKPLPPEAEKVIQEVLKGNESVSESFSSVYNEATLTVGVPIIDSAQQVIGSVLLHTPVTGVTATLNKAVSILAVSLSVALLLAIGLGIFYSILFTRPLKAMNLTALEITQGNYSARTGVNRQDEIGQLSNSLDHLAMKLGCTINQLFQEKGKLDDIISSISEGLVAFDETLKPISANFALGEIMNRPQPYLLDSVERDFKELKIEHHLKKVLDDKKPVQVLKDWMSKKLKFTVSPIIDSHEQVTGSVALVQDISQSERLEQLRRDFVANVSHEFRTPLTVIRGSVEALVDGTVENSDDIKRYQHRILSETRGLERLVGDLLELSRLQAGKILINKSEINISDLLEDTIKSLQTIADTKNIKIHYHSETALPPSLGDYDRLRQLFVIFLDNAVKYSPNNTLIYVESRIIEGNTLSILIRDQGYGIRAEELPHIWDRFYKADKSRQSHGTGLGLAIAKHLIDIHGGEVSINSELEKGTEVEVKLPLT